MSEIIMSNLNRQRAGVGQVKRHSLKVDMTPMVDLGFLLITFFVMTVQLSKPSVVNLNMPKDGPPIDLGFSNALTILLDANDHVWYYHGDWKEASAKREIMSTSYSVSTGIGKIIREKQHWLDQHNPKEGRNGLMLLIKAGKDASYKNVIKALDETMINSLRKYAVLPANNEETAWMKNQP